MLMYSVNRKVHPETVNICDVFTDSGVILFLCEVRFTIVVESDAPGTLLVQWCFMGEKEFRHLKHHG